MTEPLGHGGLMDAMLYDFGELVSTEIRRQGLSICRLAERAGVCGQTVLRVMRADKNVTMATISRIASALGFELSFVGKRACERGESLRLLPDCLAPNRRDGESRARVLSDLRLLVKQLETTQGTGEDAVPIST